jgi:hypothetical protein
VLEMLSGVLGGLPIGDGGPRWPAAVLRSKRPKRYFRSFKQLSWGSWRGICLPASTPTVRWSCKRASTMITVTSQEDTPLPPPRILPSIIATIAEKRYTGSAQNLLKIKSLRASRIAACNELPVTLLLKYMSRRFCKSKKISYFRLWRLVTGGVLDLGLKIGIY